MPFTSEEDSEAARIERETPARPGDLVVFDSTYRKLVRYATLERKEVWVGGDTYKDEFTYKVWVEADEPELAIAKGGSKPTNLSWPSPRVVDVFG